METEGSLPCSQEPATGTYHGPKDFSPYPQTSLFKIRINTGVILPPMPTSPK